MNAKESVAAYCKAQAEINNIERKHDSDKKMLNERIKTCRSLITDELVHKNISCFELYDADSTEPLYFRIKPTNTNIALSIDDVKNALNHIDRHVLLACAEKHENNIPKMICHTIQAFVREEQKQNKHENKSSLQISSNRERGYQRDTSGNISTETMRVAKDLLHARKELSSLKQRQTEQKKHCIDTQKEVESTVKEALRQSDPQNMTTRVHMMQQDNDWVYYLRCKETEKPVPVGMRKIIHIVETSATKCLNEHGLSNIYNVATPLQDSFWEDLKKMISSLFDVESKETKVISKLSLDRGAPRTKRKE